MTIKKQRFSHISAPKINETLEITVSLSQTKAAAEFSFCLSEVKFQFYFMHAAIIWYPRGLEGTGSVD